MNTFRRHSSVVIAALFTMLAACGSEQGSRTAADAPAAVSSPAVDAVECPHLDVGVLRMGGVADYEPATPDELANAVDGVVAATLDGLLPGYTVWEDGDEVPHLVARFAVTDQFGEGASDLVHDGSVYVRIAQGPISVETGRPSFGLEQFQEALPNGAEVVLFLNDITEELDSPVGSMPSDARLVGVPMEGFLVDNCGALEGGKDELRGPWKKYENLADLKASLDR